MRALILFEFSGIVRDSFIRLGHEAMSVDLIESERPGPHRIADALSVIRNPRLRHEWDVVIAFPPCTDTAVSGARWFKEKRADGRQQRAVAFARAIWKCGAKRICMENPIGILSTEIRKPDQIIQPWQFGHGETKATCLWLHNLPPLIPSRVVEGRRGRVWREPPSPDRWKNRSRTYQGIADAMAEQWGKLEWAVPRSRVGGGAHE